MILILTMFQEKRIQFDEKLNKVKDKGKALMGKWKEQTKDKKDEIMQKWEEKSREIIGNFLDLFGMDGRIVSYSIHRF